MFFFVIFCHRRLCVYFFLLSKTPKTKKTHTHATKKRQIENDAHCQVYTRTTLEKCDTQKSRIWSKVKTGDNSDGDGDVDKKYICTGTHTPLTRTLEKRRLKSNPFSANTNLLIMNRLCDTLKRCTVEEKEDIKWMMMERVKKIRKKNYTHKLKLKRKARNQMLFHLFVNFCGGHYLLLLVSFYFHFFTVVAVVVNFFFVFG